jgi:hypothetical protein
MSSKLAILFAAVVAFSSPVLAQGGGGGAGGAGSGAAGASSGGSNSGASGSNAQTGSQNQQGANGSSTPAAAAVHKAVTGADTQPASPSSGAVSAPGVGVGHAANGVPIGEPGSGPGSPEQPIDGKNVAPRYGAPSSPQKRFRFSRD